MKDFRTALLTLCISIYSGVTVALANSIPDMQPVWGMMAGDVQKWCNGCERKISDLINADAKEDCFKTTVLCTFLVDKDGHVLKPFIWRSRGLARDDERALHIIQRAQPFQKPPINLGSRRLVAIFTSNRPVEIKVDCKDYKQADSELIFERQRHSYQP